jgi:Flp pilus assembly protein TadD
VGRRPEDEVDRLRATLTANDGDHGVRERLVRLLMARGDLPAAKAELTILLKEPSRALAAQILRSRIHRSVNEVDAAVRWGKRAVETGPTDPDARLHLGLAHLASNERGSAISQLEEGVKLAPQRADLRQALGAALLRHNRVREAMSALREAVRLAPSDPAPLTLLGDAYWAGSLHREAEDAYRRALNLEEGPPVYRAMALDKLGTLYHHRGMRRRAEKVLEACQQLFPHFGCPYTDVALMPPNPIRIPGSAPVRSY